MSLLIQNIQKSYGTKQVLKNGSLLAPKGSVTALIGKNGVGKTTTFKIVCGLISAEGGEVLWNETKMHPTSMEWKKRIGYLPEHNPLYLEMPILDYLEFCALYGIVRSTMQRRKRMQRMQENFRRTHIRFGPFTISRSQGTNQKFGEK